MSLSPFDMMKNCFVKDKYLTDDELQGYTQWMMNKIISCDSTLCYLSFELSKPMTDRQHYDCLYHGLPHIDNKGKGKFIQYLCSKPKKEQEVLYLMDYFQVGQSTAKNYREIISDDEMKKIIDFNVNRGIK